jgi:hypothetical protein
MPAPKVFVVSILPVQIYLQDILISRLKDRSGDGQEAHVRWQVKRLIKAPLGNLLGSVLLPMISKYLQRS